MDEWEIFNWDLVCDYGPPISQDAIGDLAPPRHTGTVDDYIDSSTTYVLHVGITSEPHQISLFIAGLQDPPQVIVAQHHPRELETTIALAQAQEHLVPTNGNVA